MKIIKIGCFVLGVVLLIFSMTSRGSASFSSLTSDKMQEQGGYWGDDPDDCQSNDDTCWDAPSGSCPSKPEDCTDYAGTKYCVDSTDGEECVDNCPPNNGWPCVTDSPHDCEGRGTIVGGCSGNDCSMSCEFLYEDCGSTVPQCHY